MITAIVIAVALVSVYGMYWAVTSYDPPEQFFEDWDESDYLTDEEWEQEEAERRK